MVVVAAATMDIIIMDELPSKVLCISYPPLVHLDNDMIHNAMILLGEINRIRTFYDKNISLVEFRSMEEAQRAKEGLQGKLYNDPRITIDYSSNENDSSYPHKRTSDRGPGTVSQANNSDARISPGKHYSVHDYIWRGIIAKNGASVCRAVSVPIGESIRCELPDVVNCSARTGLDRLTKHYADAAIGFSIIFFLPDTDNDSALYEEFLRYLSSKDRAGVAKLCDGTHMFLVPPSDFIRKVLKVDGPPCLYGVVLKSAPSGTSFPPESYQPRYVDSPELTSSQIVQARPLLTSDLIASLSNFQPSGRVEGTAGASAGIPASDITVAPESWRYVDR
ncbi:flowering time control protein FPA-like [Solanum dulcamara]|uniref:flowering time control protein FPA-like n=1 Tax=Solanum dulcamara TaxID=45834 RepID=UPI002485B28C|nr:flowering time control protein FPA-like [Solanum dulcamara]